MRRKEKEIITINRNNVPPIKVKYLTLLFYLFSSHTKAVVFSAVELLAKYLSSTL
jgi:hypothetical protein